MSRIFLFNDQAEYTPLTQVNFKYSFATQIIYNAFDRYYKSMARDIVVISEQRYWDLKDYNTLLMFIEKYNIDLNRTYFIVDSFLEPRSVDYSVSIEFLCRELNIPGKQVTFLTSTSNKDRDNRHFVNIEEVPGAAIIFSGHGGYGIGSDRKKISDINPKGIIKTKLFSTLNRRINISRFSIVSALHNAFDEDEYTMSLGAINNAYIKTEELKFYQRLGFLSGGCKTFFSKVPLVFDKKVINPHNNEQWIFDNPELSKSLFGIVNETNGKNLWMDNGTKITHSFHYASEKSLIPFFNFQIPIFFDSSPGHFKWFKESYGLDLFEDIVPHEEFEKIDDVTYRARKVVEFLKEQKSKSYRKVFLTHKDRFIKNLEILHNVRLQYDSHILDIGDRIMDKILDLGKPGKIQ